MDSLRQAYRTWILGQRVCGVAPVAKGDDCLLVLLDHATARVRFYPAHDGGDIVELLVTHGEDERPTFFLHFMLEDLRRAQELFDEMAAALEEHAQQDSVRILLTCTSAMTTSFLAAKMREVAQSLALPYEFHAMSFDRALAEGDGYAAILLAPQVGHRRQEMAKAHPEAVVFEIPGKTFGSYDAAAAVRLVMHALREVHVPGDDTGDLRAMRDLSNDKCILVITLFVLRRDTRMGYRIYEHGSIAREGVVRKARFDYRDVEDLVETLSVHGIDLRDLDAIGIAVPGVAYKGKVSLPGVVDGTYDLGGRLSRRFGIRVHVENNCNAAAVGCYVAQDSYESLVFYRHEFGHVAGGLGTVIDGRLLKGRLNLAGEPQYFESRFAYESGYDEARWSSEGLFQIVQNVALSSVALVSPEALYIAADTIDDMDALHDALAQVLPEELVPPLFKVSDYVERVYLGEMALCLHKP